MKSHSSLWSPNEAIKDKSQLKKFCKQLEKKHFLKHNVDFENLWKWSIKNPEKFSCFARNMQNLLYFHKIKISFHKLVHLVISSS